MCPAAQKIALGDFKSTENRHFRQMKTIKTERELRSSPVFQEPARFVGRRLRLNPLGVSLSLLFWAWIWGPVGLVLAMPILGTTKIVCDYVEPLRGVGQWLGDSLT